MHDYCTRAIKEGRTPAQLLDSFNVPIDRRPPDDAEQTVESLAEALLAWVCHVQDVDGLGTVALHLEQSRVCDAAAQGHGASGPLLHGQKGHQRCAVRCRHK